MLTNADIPRRTQLLGRVPVEELRSRRDEGLQVEWLGELAEDGVEHFGLVGLRLKELGAPIEDDLRKHVDREDGLAREQDVEKARDFVLRLYVVGVHGEGARQGKEGLGLREVGPEPGVRGVQDAGDETELGDGGVEVGQHEIPDAKEREAGDCGAMQPGWEDEEEDLCDVVVALEVVYVGVAAQDGEDQV